MFENCRSEGRTWLLQQNFLSLDLPGVFFADQMPLYIRDRPHYSMYSVSTAYWLIAKVLVAPLILCSR